VSVKADLQTSTQRIGLVGFFIMVGFVISIKNPMEREKKLKKKVSHISFLNITEHFKRSNNF